MPLRLLDQTNFEETLASIDRALVCFSMDNCKPCNVVKLKLALCAHQFADEFSCFVVDTVKCPVLRAEYADLTVPMIYLFRRGQFGGLFGGPRSVERLRKFATDDDFVMADEWCKSRVFRWGKTPLDIESLDPPRNT